MIDKTPVEDVNLFPITLMFKNPVPSINAQVIFTSEDGKDIRVFILKASIRPMPIYVNPLIQANIEILANIGEMVTQEIPIINYSAKDWPIKVNLVNNNTKATNFTGPPS